MNISTKRILSAIAAVVLSASTVPLTTPLLYPALTACAEDNIPDGLSYDLSADGSGVVITKWSDSATEVVIPATIEGLPVTGIASWSFNGCESVEKVTLPDSIKVISNNSFSRCTKLAYINIPDGVTNIGDGAFSSCTSLKSIKIPDSVASLGIQAFASCSALDTIVIPSTLTSIGANAFRDTAWLNARKSEKPLVIVNNILIDGTAASGSVTITDDIKSIGDMAFSNCLTLTDISIPEGVTYIGESAFYQCSSLKSISIPDGGRPSAIRLSLAARHLLTSNFQIALLRQAEASSSTAII